MTNPTFQELMSEQAEQIRAEAAAQIPPAPSLVANEQLMATRREIAAVEGEKQRVFHALRTKDTNIYIQRSKVSFNVGGSTSKNVYENGWEMIRMPLRRHVQHGESEPFSYIDDSGGLAMTAKGLVVFTHYRGQEHRRAFGRTLPLHQYAANVVFRDSASTEIVASGEGRKISLLDVRRGLARLAVSHSLAV